MRSLSANRALSCHVAGSVSCGLGGRLVCGLPGLCGWPLVALARLGPPLCLVRFRSFGRGTGIPIILKDSTRLVFRLRSVWSILGFWRSWFGWGAAAAVAVFGLFGRQLTPEVCPAAGNVPSVVQ